MPPMSNNRMVPMAIKKAKMKNYIVLFCLFLVPMWAEGTITTGLSEDEPPYIYVESYSIVQSGGGSASGVDQLIYPFSCSYGYAVISYGNDGGNMSFSPTFSGTYTGIGFDSPFGINYAPFSLTEQISGGSSTSPMSVIAILTNEDVQMISFSGSVTDGPINYATNGVYYVTNVPQIGGPWLGNVGESGSCSENYSSNIVFIGYNSNVHFHENVVRTSETIMKLKTGGPAGSKLRNVYRLNVSAGFVSPSFYDVNYYERPIWGDSFFQYFYSPEGGGGPIYPQSISIGSYGNQSTNGIKYILLPDDSDVDVTPQVAGGKDFFYAVNVNKYNSYFEIFTEPTTSYPLKDLTTGHAFWRLSTDVPSDYYQAALPSNLYQFINQCEGFYPTNETGQAMMGLTGVLQPDNGSLDGINLGRKFYISFPDLVAGLAFTYSVKQSPPTYYLIGGDNCVTEAENAAFDVGFNWKIFAFLTPHDLEAQLLVSYPGPSINNSIIYDIR
jgi:hypothetical protein